MVDVERIAHEQAAVDEVGPLHQPPRHVVVVLQSPPGEDDLVLPVNERRLHGRRQPADHVALRLVFGEQPERVGEEVDHVRHRHRRRDHGDALLGVRVAHGIVEEPDQPPVDVRWRGQQRLVLHRLLLEPTRQAKLTEDARRVFYELRHEEPRVLLHV